MQREKNVKSNHTNSFLIFPWSLSATIVETISFISTTIIINNITLNILSNEVLSILFICDFYFFILISVVFITHHSTPINKQCRSDKKSIILDNISVNNNQGWCLAHPPNQWYHPNLWYRSFSLLHLNFYEVVFIENIWTPAFLKPQSRLSLVRVFRCYTHRP